MKDDVTLVAACRRSPVRTALFTVLPILLAGAQVLNGLFTDLALWIALAFAAVMVSYAAVYTQYNLARDRLEVLESGTTPRTAD